MNLQNKTVFITGGGRRIGMEIARFFALNGANIALHYNSSFNEAAKLQEELGKERCQLFKADLTDTSTSVLALKSAISRFGKIEFLINNASMFEKNSIMQITEEEFERDINITLKTPLFLMQEFARQKFASEEGLIVNILDANIKRTNTQFVSYLLAKKGLDELTRFAGFELAPNIRTNSISPGIILENEAALSEIQISKIPLKRNGNVADLIKIIELFIKTPYLNGVNIPIDGGYSL
jgi:NAD(P)-dependent dehydrogenase (short-subunit alcohol dehydrogenase family)